MDLLRQAIDAIGKLGWIRHQIARRVPAGRPAVVQDDVLIAEILESERDELFGRV